MADWPVASPVLADLKADSRSPSEKMQVLDLSSEIQPWHRPYLSQSECATKDEESRERNGLSQGAASKENHTTSIRDLEVPDNNPVE